MIRPYLAVVKDSFREALASRVLWILLVVTTLLLVAIAPLGITEQAGAYFGESDIVDGRALIAKIKAQQASSKPSPGLRLWALLSDDLKKNLAESPQETGPGRWPGLVVLELREELNEALASRTLYDPAAWSGIELGAEAADLLKRAIARLEGGQLLRLNRLLLEAAYPEEIAPSRRRDLSLSYAGLKFGGPLPRKKDQFIGRLVTAFMNFFVGTLGVMAAIVVTASIIPQTFEAGAIDLLLSKPISRSWLFVTKFLGGCAFSLINAVYVIGGVWWILGLRFGIWSEKLLLCIPLFMFLFAIYYAVSALAGVLWKNAIVCVVMTVLFWGMCWAVGTGKNVTELFFLNATRLVKVVPAGDTLVGVNEGGEVLRWRPDDASWQEILAAEGQDDYDWSRPFGLAAPMIGPVWDEKSGRLLAIPGRSGQFGFLQSGSYLVTGKRAENWKRVQGVDLPSGTAALFVAPGGEPIAVAPRGIFRAEGDPTRKQRRVKLLGLEIPLANTGGRFVAAGPDMRLRQPFSAAMHPRTGAVAIFDGKNLALVAPDAAGKYAVRVTRELTSDEPGVVAVAGSTLVLGLADGRVRVFSLADLKLRRDFRPCGHEAPRFVEASPDGRRFAVVFHNRRLWLYDAAAGQEIDSQIAGQGDVSAAAFDSSARLLVADRFTRVTEYEWDSFQARRRYSPERGWLERVYWYGLKPLYTVFPKPGELGNMVAYLLTDQQTTPVTGNVEDLRAIRVKLNIWGPIWSNAAFVAVCIALGCWYTHRKDF